MRRARTAGSRKLRSALVAAIAGQPYQEKNIIKTRPVNRSNLAAFLAGRQAQKFDEKHALSDLDLSGIRIGLSIMNLNNPFFATFAHVIAEEAKRLGVELVINDPKPVLGVLNVLTNVANGLDTEDQLALEGICGQIAAAIESTRLRQEMEDRLRELNALQRLVSREGWQAFQATREQAAQAYLFDQTSVRATTVAELGLLHNGTAQKELLASAAMSNSHIIARPMAVRGEIIGALGIQDDADAPLPPEDQAFLAAVAQQVAEALERARLLEQTQKRAAGLEAVAQVSAVTSTTLETQKLLQTAVDLTKTNFGLYHAHIYLLDEAGQNLTLAVGAGEVGEQMVAQGWQIPLNHKHSLVAQAARTRQGVIVNEARESPDFLPNPLLPETRSEVAIPLIAGDSLLGVLDVQADEINHFTEEDMQVKTVLAAQIATALHNANLYQQTQAALAETESLYNAGRRLNETGNLQEIVAAVVEGLSVTTINRAVLMMFERDSAGEVEVMTVTANWHSGKGTLPTPIGVEYPRAMFANLGVLLSSDPLFFDDIQHDERVDPATVAIWQQLNIRAMAVLPLTVGSRQLGSLLLEAEEPHPFTEHDIRLSRSIMGQAAVAIENQRLFNETRVALAEVEATQRRYTVQAWETYKIKNNVLSYEQVREGVTPLAENLLPEISKTLAQKRLQSAQPPLGTADGRPQLIDGGQRSAVGGQLDSGHRYPKGISSPVTGQMDAADSSLIIPLMVRGETIGVLGLQETGELRAWSPEEITLVEAIAEQLAQAAENIRLIDETQQRAAREKRVNEIGEKIQAAQSLEEALQVAVKEVGLSLQASQTIVQLEVK
jgi:GAF domain-containing protein